MANSLVVHIMLNEGSEVPKASIQLEFIGASSNTEHMGLFRSYFLHPNSESHILFFFNGLLVLQGIFFQKFNFFSTGSIGPQSFSSVGVHRSRFEYGALGLVSIISPSFELGIMHRFFYELLIIQGIFCQIFKFFLNQLN